jgi:hypothetical protein
MWQSYEIIMKYNIRIAKIILPHPCEARKPENVKNIYHIYHIYHKPLFIGGVE